MVVREPTNLLQLLCPSRSNPDSELCVLQVQLDDGVSSFVCVVEAVQEGTTMAPRTLLTPVALGP